MKEIEHQTTKGQQFGVSKIHEFVFDDLIEQIKKEQEEFEKKEEEKRQQ
jgi:hypothetical protein